MTQYYFTIILSPLYNFQSDKFLFNHSLRNINAIGLYIYDLCVLSYAIDGNYFNILVFLQNNVR